MSETSAYDAWIGREEEATDEARPSDLDRFRAIFGESSLWQGEELPALAHWMLFPTIVAQEKIGHDGHPKRGGFLPPIDHLPRRMWAGGSLSFHAPIKAGRKLIRRSVIKKITPKTGGSGELVFVKVAHTISDVQGPVLIEEDQDLVYRGRGGSGRPFSAPEEETVISETIAPDPVMLFRYSAATFNGHRIHYDQAYAVEDEGYRGLVVHGPLMATLLLRLASKTAGRQPDRFVFRGASPAIVGDELRVSASAPDGDGTMRCWIENAAGHLVMSAESTFSKS